MATKDRSFPIHELLVALLRDQNIHKGHWGLTVHFNASGTTVAATDQPGMRLPGLAIAVTGVTLISAKPGEEGSVDASLVNPARSGARPKKATSVRGEKLQA